MTPGSIIDEIRAFIILVMGIAIVSLSGGLVGSPHAASPAILEVAQDVGSLSRIGAHDHDIADGEHQPSNGMFEEQSHGYALLASSGHVRIGDAGILNHFSSDIVLDNAVAVLVRPPAASSFAS